MAKPSRSSRNLTYVALLRGINVGGHKIIKMDQLRKAFEAIGLQDVKTYVQSGNLVFKAPPQTREALCRRLEKEILAEFRMSVPVIVRTAEEIAKTLQSNPFLQEKGIDTSKLHVTFLSRLPEQAAVRTLDAIASAPDRFQCLGQEIYLCCPNGFGGTKLSINVFERLLSVGATTRNWNTLTRLHQISLL